MKRFSPYFAFCALLLAASACSPKRSALTVQYENKEHIDTTLPSQAVVVPKGNISAGQLIVEESRRWLGTPYKYGGNDSEGIDCSGLVCNVFENVLAAKIPRSSAQQQQWCIPMLREDLQQGDLVFFSSKSEGEGVGHVGIYAGSDSFVHASSSRGVVVSKLSEPYFERHFISAGRPPVLAAEVDISIPPVDSVAEHKAIQSAVRQAMIF